MDTLAGFMRTKEREDMSGRRNRDVYEEYERYCFENGEMPMEFVSFMIHLCRLHPYRMVQKCVRGEVIKVLERKHDDVGLSEYLEGRDAHDLEGLPTAICYEHYLGVCDSLGCPKMNRNDFSRKVCARLGMRTKNAYVDGEYVRVFAGIM